jgi:4-amino-4-deoxy-L-arabinose transferase-like glycosyltransferase
MARPDALVRHERLIFGAVMLGALVLRVWRLDLAQMAYDEAAAASLVEAWRLDGVFPLTGIVSSINVVNPPAWPYVLAVGLLVSDQPYAVLAEGILFGLLAVFLTWHIGRRWFGPWAGLGAAVFYAGGFFPVLLGRSAWQPAFLPVLTLMCLDAFLMLAAHKKPWALVAVCAWLALLVQFHYVAGLYGLLLPIAAWPARKVLRPVHVAAAGLTVLIALLPFLLYELHPAVRFVDAKTFIATQSSGAPHVDLAVFNYLWNLSSNAGALGLATPSVDGLRPLLGRWSSAALFGSVLVAVGAVSALAWRPRGWRGGLLVAWLVLPQLVLARHTLDVLLHYVYLDLPVLALVVGCLLAATTVRGQKLLRLGVLGALGVYVAASVGTLWVVLGYVESADVHKGYGAPLRDSLAAGRAAAGVVPPGAPVLVAGHHFEAEIIRFTLGYQTPSRVLDDCQELPYVPGAVYVLMSEQTPAGSLLPAAGAPLLTRVPRPGDAYLIYASPSTPPDASSLGTRPEQRSTECQERRVWGRAS